MEPDRKAVSPTESTRRELLGGTLRSRIVESGLIRIYDLYHDCGTGLRFKDRRRQFRDTR